MSTQKQLIIRKLCGNVEEKNRILENETRKQQTYGKVLLNYGKYTDDKICNEDVLKTGFYHLEFSDNYEKNKSERQKKSKNNMTKIFNIPNINENCEELVLFCKCSS